MKKTLLFMGLLALCNLALFAQTVRIPRIVHTPERSAIHVPPQERPASLKTIYSNLGSSKTDLYQATDSWALAGPNAYPGFPVQFHAIPFTPKSNSTVTQVRVAAQYWGVGANQVNLSIYGDTNNGPGTLLAGPVTVTNLPSSGTCCTLAVANFSPGVAVTAGTQYWVTADTPLSGTGSDFAGGWNLVIKTVRQGANGDNEGHGWFGFDSLLEAAGEVLGTIP